MVRRVRIAGKQIEHLFPIPHPAGIDLVPENHLRIRIMEALVKPKLRVSLGLANGPAGETARHLNDVFLRISAVNAKRMQFHQLAAVILIQTALLFFGLIRIRARRRKRGPAERAAKSGTISTTRRLFLLQPLPSLRIDTLPIIQVKKHGRAFCRGLEQVAEFTHSMRANGVALIRSEQPAIRALSGKDVEMVEPEIHHLLVELFFAVNGAIHLGHGQFSDDALGRLYLLKIESWIARAIAGAVLVRDILCPG